MKRLSALLLAALAIAGTALAAPDDELQQVRKADQAFESRNWPTALPLYEALAKRHPESARLAYRLAVALQGTGQHDKALAAFAAALKQGAPAGNVEFGLATVHAALHDAEQAFTHLSAATRQGWDDPEELDASADFAALRSDPRYAQLRTQAQRNRSPCTYAPESRQFDFWIGDWDVSGTEDQGAAGHSHIERAIGDCVIWENWTSLGHSGYYGKSYNAWNPHLARWEQFWVDNSGDLMHFFGKLDQGIMDFWTDAVPQGDGTTLTRHLQFIPLPDGSVRQYSRGSVDGGKTWQVEYDFTYRRAAAAGAGAAR